jgi:hypothetical protein
VLAPGRERPAGSIGRTDIDLDSTLNLDQESNGFAYIAIEHPIPVLPNLRVQHSEMNWTGSALVTAGTDLNGTPFTTTQQADIASGSNSYRCYFLL